MNVEIGAEATQFPEKEYINRIAVAVWHAWSVAHCMAVWLRRACNARSLPRHSKAHFPGRWYFLIPKCSTNGVLGSYVKKLAETQTSIRLASHLVRAPNS